MKSLRPNNWIFVIIGVLWLVFGACERDNGRPCDLLINDTCAIDTGGVDSCQFNTCAVDTCIADTCSPCIGVTGEWRSLGLSGETILSVLPHPTDPRVIFAGSQFDFSLGRLGKLFKTTDCGANWDTLIVGQFGWNFRHLSFEPGNPDVIYVCVGGYLAGTAIMRSSDGGENWVELKNGIFIDGETWVDRVAIDPQKPQNLYCFTTGFFGGRLYSSRNNGATWNEISNSPHFDGFYGFLLPDPDSSGHLYVGASNGKLVRSLDYGVSWEILDTFMTESAVTFANIDGMVPLRRWIVGVPPFGFLKSMDNDQSWSPLQATIDNQLFDTSQLITIANDNNLMFATWSNQVYLSTNAGVVWAPLGTPSSNGVRLVRASDINGMFVFAGGSEDGLWRFRR